MNIAVPVIYEPENGRRRRVSGMTFELAEISADEACVAVEHRSISPSRYRLDGGTMIKYLSYGGHLWQPRGLMAHEIYRYDPGRSVGEQYAASRYQFNNSKNGIHPTDAHSRVQLYSDSYEIEEDGSPDAARSPMAAAYKQTFSAHMLIDGDLYVRSRGPLIALVNDTNGAIVMHTDGYGSYSIHGRIREFRADMQAEVCAIADRMFGRVTVMGEPAIIHDPTALPEESCTGAVEDLAWRLMAETRADYLGSQSRDVVAASLAIRNALAHRWPDRVVNFNYTTWGARPYSEWETRFLPDADLIPLIDNLNKSYRFQKSLRDDIEIARTRTFLAQHELRPEDAEALGL